MDNTNYDSKHTGPEIDSAIDRAKVGGEIDDLLAGKAPAGYGLGGGATKTVETDFNNYIDNGVFMIPASMESIQNAPPIGNYGMLEVSRGSNVIVQDAWGPDWGHGYVYWTHTRRVCTSSNGNPDYWSEWEWVDPPMELGVEYRTTERYLGKPVYVKLVDFGNYPASGTKTVAHGISNVKNIVSCLGTSSMGYSVNGFQYVDHLYADTANVYITVNADVSKNQVKVILKYTKTTD